MRKKGLAYCLILIELIIQIFGSIYYSQTPEIVWSLANAILIVVPLAFGLWLGLLCFLPVVVSEIVWYCSLNALGPLLHVASFALTILIMGWANKKLKSARSSRRTIISSILYELSLLGEEALYYGFMFLFLHRSIRWEKISGTFLSWANPLVLIILIICCKDGYLPEDGSRSSE